MERRELIKMIGLLTGGVVIGADLFLGGCKNPASELRRKWSEDELALLNEIGETILPTTHSSPGAKAAKVGEFMNVFVNDCYEEYQVQAFNDGLTKINADCKAKTGKSFLKCDAHERQSFLVVLDKEAREFNQQNAQKPKTASTQNKEVKQLGNHYFTYMKQLTLLGYFTSKIGCTEALRYIPVPGHYDGNLPYAKGDKAWAT
ncbi:gluconate 2-dehydrogenase subunit 3 family protein [Chitinophagaceae bacterium 26-R-25]|nr:gluconate 2-dehydrogenase subunit 3 family protein [Chitinophagaceae bacterium 26-R-25]